LDLLKLQFSGNCTEAKTPDILSYFAHNSEQNRTNAW